MPLSKLTRLVAWHVSVMPMATSVFRQSNSEWIDLLANRPLSSGDSIFVPETGRAELHIGSSALRLQEKSLLNINAITDDNVQVRLSQGSMVVRIRTLQEREFSKSARQIWFHSTRTW